MFRKIRLVLVKSAHSKEGLDEKTPEQPKQEKPKSKNKFLGLFHSSSDPDLDSKQKTRKSFLRRKKNHEKENKESQDGAVSEVLTNHTEKLPDNLLSDKPLPDGSLPDGSIPDGQLPDGSLRDGQLPDNLLPDNLLPENGVQDNVDNVPVEKDIVENFENASQNRSILDEAAPLDPLKSMSVSTIDSMHRVNRIDFDPFPPDGGAWERAKDVWEKNEIEETKEKEKEKRRKKERKEHHDKKRERKEEKDGKSRHRSKSREKDKEHTGKERSDTKNRTKEKKRHDKHEHDEDKYEEKRSKDDKHKKHKSRGEKHGGGHKRDISGGYDSDSQMDSKHERKSDRKHKHKNEHRQKNDSDHDRDRSYDHARDRSYDHARDRSYDHARDRSYDHARDDTPLDHAHDGTPLDHTLDGTLDRAHAKEHKHHDHPKHKDDKHTKKSEEHHKHSKHKEPKTEHKHTKEHTKKSSPFTEDGKRLDLDKVWREYESGKRYHSQEKDMKKIIDRLDGVERFRREERQRLSDRSHDRSSDTSHEVTHRSRSRERRRRSRSREKQRHESDQDSNHSSTWQYSLNRIEARQEQCKAEIDTARRSIEHRIKQLEARFEKHYSSSERLPDQPREKPSAEEPREYKKIIDQVADECREVTRTLEVRTEEMKSEIATVVREELTHLDEKLHSPSSPSSPGPFFGMRVVGNFRCEEATTTIPGKLTRDNDRSKQRASGTSVEPISSADESMVTVIEENSRIARTTPKDCAGDESNSAPSSRDSPVRVSQSGALDTLNEPSGQKHSISSTCDSGISADHPMSPLHLRSPGIENLHELSLESFEDEAHYDEEGHDCDGTQGSLQEVYRRKIKETEARCQERALEEKEMLYRRINELESMLLASREGKGQYV